MKHLVAAAAVCAALVGAAGAFASGSWDDGYGTPRGSGFVRSQDRTVPPFTAVVVEGSGEVILSPSLVQSVTVETDDNLLDVVTTDVVGGVLHLGFRPGTRIGHLTRLSFRISAPSIDGIAVNGSGSLRTTAPLRDREIALRIGGSGSIDASLAADTVRAEIGGSGDITMDGQSTQLSVTIDGSGSVRARDLQAETADVRIGGSGSADVTAKTSLSIGINGSGDVTYGGGARASVHSSGSGTARER